VFVEYALLEVNKQLDKNSIYLDVTKLKSTSWGNKILAKFMYLVTSASSLFHFMHTARYTDVITKKV